MSFVERRKELHRRLGQDDGVVLFLGGSLQARNYLDNPYMPFRQSSHFLYYTGITSPGFALLSFPSGKDVLYGPEVGMDTIVWTGPQPSLSDWGLQAEVSVAKPISALALDTQEQEELLYLPPFQSDMQLQMARLLRRKPHEVAYLSSSALVAAVVAQRSCKTPEEVVQIEEALALTRSLFHMGMAVTKAGMSAAELYGHFAQVVFSSGADFAFPPIVTTHGEILHNHSYGDVLQDGALLLVDMGAEIAAGYASDITRAWPVSGTFSPQQKDIYELVLASQLKAIEAIKPGLSYREVHLLAAEVIVEGLIGLGLMKDDPQEAVAAGAHALFFPHGLGHMMGLDVHDMEDLGDVVGYGSGAERSEQFGLNFLRLSRELEAGYVVTVEPGVYFIPALIDMWRKEKRHEAFIAYDAVEAFRSFGGIRIEDDVLVTKSGSRVLGPPIAKTCKQVEQEMRATK